MTPSEVTYLESLKNVHTKSGILASNILYGFDGRMYEHLMPVIEETPPSYKAASSHPIYYEEILPDAGYELFPNPGNGQFTISSLSKPIASNASILIHDLMGKLIKRINLTQETKFIHFDLNEFPSGAYTISLQDAQGVLFNSKLIKTP